MRGRAHASSRPHEDPALPRSRLTSVPVLVVLVPVTITSFVDARKPPTPTRLRCPPMDMTGMSKGVVWVNGFNLGRYSLQGG